MKRNAQNETFAQFLMRENTHDSVFYNDVKMTSDTFSALDLDTSNLIYINYSSRYTTFFYDSELSNSPNAVKVAATVFQAHFEVEYEESAHVMLGAYLDDFIAEEISFSDDQLYIYCCNLEACFARFEVITAID